MNLRALPTILHRLSNVQIVLGDYPACDTFELRRRILTDIIQIGQLSPEEAAAFIRAALVPAAFARTEVLSLRLAQALSQVTR